MNRGALTKVVLIGPYLLAVLGFFVRAVGIGSLLPYVDEAAFILTSIDEQTRLSLAPERLGRPLAAILFQPVQLLHKYIFVQWSLIELARHSVSFVVFLTTVFLIPIGYRLGGRVGAWIVSLIWTLCPLSFLHGRLALQDHVSAFFLALVCGYIFYRPARVGARESRGEILWLLVAGAAFLFALLNKITGVLELPWLCALYGGEQWRRQEKILEGGKTKGCVAGFVLIGMTVFVLLLANAWERISNFRRVSSEVQLGTVLSNLVPGIANVQYLVTGYCGVLLTLFFLAAVVLAPVLLPQIRVLASGVAVTVFVYAFAFGPIFPGRYLVPFLIPLSLVVAGAGGAVLHGGRSALNVRLGAFEYRWWAAGRWVVCCAGLTGVLLWIGQIVTVLRDPFENAFSGLSWKWTQRPMFRDYGQYTTSYWSSFGVDRICSFFRTRLAEDPEARVSVFGAPYFGPDVYATRLMMFDEPRIVIAEGEWRRWDFPFLVATSQRSFQGEGISSVVYLLDGSSCEAPPLELCQPPLPQPVGVSLRLEEEILRVDRQSRFRIFRAAAVEDEVLSTLTPPNEGLYSDGLVAPVIEAQVVIAEGGGTEQIVVEGYELEGAQLSLERARVFVDGLEVQVDSEQREGRFRLIVSSPSAPGERQVKVFFGGWQMRVDPFKKDALSANIQRAVSAREVTVTTRRK